MHGVSLSRARKDLKYLFDKYGYTNDYCGSYCNTKVLTNILFGKTTIKETVIENIERYFHASDIKPDVRDETIKEIAKRYAIDLTR